MWKQPHFWWIIDRKLYWLRISFELAVCQKKKKTNNIHSRLGWSMRIIHNTNTCWNWHMVYRRDGPINTNKKYHISNMNEIYDSNRHSVRWIMLTQYTPNSNLGENFNQKIHSKTIFSTIHSHSSVMRKNHTNSREFMHLKEWWILWVFVNLVNFD